MTYETIPKMSSSPDLRPFLAEKWSFGKLGKLQKMMKKEI